MNKRKFIILISTVVLTITLFSIETYLQRKAVKFTPKTDVVICTTTSKQGKNLSGSSFTLEERPVTDVPSSAIKNLNEIKDKVAISTIYKGEILNKNRITSKDDPNYFGTSGMGRFSIPMAYIDNPVFAGTLRNGDVISIIHTDTPTAQQPIPQTNVQVKQAKVVAAIDNQGKFLQKGDNVLATEIILEGNQKECVDLTNGQYTGKYKYVQISTGNN